MDPLDSIFNDYNPKIRAGDIPSKKTRDLKILKAINHLKHACECTNSKCPDLNCYEMKSIVIHSKHCDVNPRKNCRSCKQLIALCLFHIKRSKTCESEECVIPFCARFKHSLILKRKVMRKKLRELYNLKFVTPPPPTTSIEIQIEPSSITQPDLKGFPEQHQPSENQTVIYRVLDQPKPLSFKGRTETENAQNQVKRLLHAHECLSGEVYGAVSAWSCPESDCILWKIVLRHIISCFHDNCDLLHCKTSKDLFFHWETCREQCCSICAPIREMIIWQVLTSNGTFTYPLKAPELSAKEWHHDLENNFSHFTVSKLSEMFLPKRTLYHWQLCQVAERLGELEKVAFAAADSKKQYDFKIDFLIHALTRKMRHNRYNMVIKETSVSNRRIKKEVNP